MEQLAKNLLALRATKKLSREKAAKAVNISSKNYERYEKVSEPLPPRCWSNLLTFLMSL